MNIIWTDFAVKNLKEIYNYYNEKAGRKITQRIRDDIFSSVKQLKKNPKAGQVEFLLEELGEEYRYLVCGNYKLVYKLVNQDIMISDVFDARQNPIKLNDLNR